MDDVKQLKPWKPFRMEFAVTNPSKSVRLDQQTYYDEAGRIIGAGKEGDTCPPGTVAVACYSGAPVTRQLRRKE